jgi:hypothetical protein
MLSAILSSKIALIVVTLVGMAMCTAGIGRVAAQGQWLHPLALVGSLLGVAILLLVGAALFNIKLPLIDSTQAALIAVIVVVILKVALTQLHVSMG